MTSSPLEDLCETGQGLLMEMRYLEAETTLARAEAIALAARDWDRLSRLYMPLQEARRQRRQRCGEGIVCLDLLAEGPRDHFEARHVLENYSHGQLLVAGWGTLEPAARVRAMAAEHGLYVETFLGATYPAGGERVVVVAPFADSPLPVARAGSVEELLARLPAGCLVIEEADLPRGARKGTYETYGEVMAIWERLHRPFLGRADAEPDLEARIEAYRQTIKVDYACELAHQNLSQTAKMIHRRDAEKIGSPQMHADEHG